MVLQWPEPEAEHEAAAVTSIASGVIESIHSSVEVEEFCAAHDLNADLIHLTRLVNRHMTGVAEITNRLQSEPETGETWLLVDAALEADTKDVTRVLAEYNALLQDWITTTEAKARDLITLTFSFT